MHGTLPTALDVGDDLAAWTARQRTLPDDVLALLVARCFGDAPYVLSAGIRLGCFGARRRPPAVGGAAAAAAAAPRRRTPRRHVARRLGRRRGRAARRAKL